MNLQGVNQFLAELESHCPQRAIATFLGSDGQPFAIDLTRKGTQIIYGSQPQMKELLIAKLLHHTHPVASLILRSFLPELDELTQLPIKEIRGYVLKRLGSQLEFEKLSPEQMFACQNTDAETGEPLPLEQSVRYC
ncbi:hypothetical protein [Phormidium sp. CCY1219]|uniref:hypothetical protein n=1 Tax=Phormidium sp. CCY1219 TaxID=2886104 RepID=UPI002D1F6B70|nr:hypothetical protein [Phormidium sp. CCY1219]MEB3829936.1 hypothetical protein [Phormidium sp. CCY1219]